MAWRFRKPANRTERARVLRALADLSAEDGGRFVPTYDIVRRLGHARDIGLVLEALLSRGLTERGPIPDGTWGDRPTDAGLRELIRFDA
jgi:hypothetical protein